MKLETLSLTETMDNIKSQNLSLSELVNRLENHKPSAY